MALTKSPITLPAAERLNRTELFDVLDELPESAFPRSDATRWPSSGLTWTTRDCDAVDTEATDCTAGNPLQDGLEMESESTRDTQTECVNEETGAFMLWSALSGSTLDAENEVVGKLTLDKLGDFTQFAMAQELITGTVGGNGLSTTATSVGGAVTIANGAVGVMEEWLGARVGNTRGVLHVSKTTLAALYAATAITFDGGRYYTPSGHYVLADAGYQESIMAPSGGAASTAANGYAYITGPVWYVNTIPKLLGAGWQQLDRDTNILEAIATAYAAFAYRACAVGSMLITY